MEDIYHQVQELPMLILWLMKLMVAFILPVLKHHMNIQSKKMEAQVGD